MLINSPKFIGTIAYMGGVPAVLEEFCWAWGQLIDFCSDYMRSPSDRLFYDRAKVSDHAFARNMLAHRMQGDWLLMLDTDHVFDPDLALRLLREFDKNNLDVLTGLYQYRQSPHSPVWWITNAEGQMAHLGTWVKPETDGPYLVPLRSSGAGCLIVRRRVFDRIADELHEPPFQHIGGMSEDHSFFERCRRLGIVTYGCPCIEAPHLAVKPVQLGDYHPDELPQSDLIPVGA